MRLCCWLRVDWSGVEPLRQKAGLVGRGVFLCVNHQSFLDTPLVCVLLPARLVADAKVLMSRAVLRLPVVGFIGRCVGHFSVPYTGFSSDDFSLDPGELPQLLSRMEDHAASGGHLIVFPEGMVNSRWAELQRFRGGGFEVAIRHDMEVWGLVIAGTGQCWPKAVALGGGPGRLDCMAVRIAESAQALAARLAGSEAGLQQKGRALANEARQTMQRELDELIARRRADGVAAPEAAEPAGHVALVRRTEASA